MLDTSTLLNIGILSGGGAIVMMLLYLTDRKEGDFWTSISLVLVCGASLAAWFFRLL